MEPADPPGAPTCAISTECSASDVLRYKKEGTNKQANKSNAGH